MNRDLVRYACLNEGLKPEFHLAAFFEVHKDPASSDSELILRSPGLANLSGVLSQHVLRAVDCASDGRLFKAIATAAAWVNVYEPNDVSSMLLVLKSHNDALGRFESHNRGVRISRRSAKIADMAKKPISIQPDCCGFLGGELVDFFALDSRLAAERSGQLVEL